MLDSTGVGAVESVGGVPERHELAVIWLEQVPDRRGLYLEDDDHERPHQERRVGLLVEFVARPVEQFEVFELRVRQQTHELPHEFVGHSQVQGSEIVIEGVVYKFVVDGEEIRILVGSGRPSPGDEEQAVLDNFDVGRGEGLGGGCAGLGF